MRPTLLGVVSTLIILGCLPAGGESDNVLEGACQAGETHCVDTETIQECADGEWAGPTACPPELSTSGEFPVEILTWCTDGGCRPGG